jgi:hypothetical protein
LSGHPAKVAGRHLEYAIVAPLDPQMGTIEYSWAVVDRIMGNGGRFMVLDARGFKDAKAVQS